MVTIMWVGAGVDILGGPPLDPKHKGEGTSVGRGPSACGGMQYLLPMDGRDIGVPRQGLKGGVSIRYNLRVHLAHRNMQDTIFILIQGNHNHPLSPNCDMFSPWKDLN